jgi:hypothetical protein
LERHFPILLPDLHWEESFIVQVEQQQENANRSTRTPRCFSKALNANKSLKGYQRGAHLHAAKTVHWSGIDMDPVIVQPIYKHHKQSMLVDVFPFPGADLPKIVARPEVWIRVPRS